MYEGFAREWIAEHEAGRPELNKRLAKDAEHPIEAAGKSVRDLMPWLEEDS